MDRNLSVFVVDNVYFVALRKESVDRNLYGLPKEHLKQCRSPQGERG